MNVLMIDLDNLLIIPKVTQIGGCFCIIAVFISGASELEASFKFVLSFKKEEAILVYMNNFSVAFDCRMQLICKVSPVL